MFFKDDGSRFEEFYREHHSIVRGVLYNMVDRSAVEDLTQESFIKIWNGLSRFSFQSSTRTWVYRITVNVAIDYLRVKKLSAVSLDEIAETKSDDSFESEAHINRELVREALLMLDENHRSVIVLNVFEGLSVDEIAGVLQIADGTVKSRLFNARIKMKNFLEAKGVKNEPA